MADIEGIIVVVETSSQSRAGTDQPVFVGIFGTGGGREFNLNVENFDDFQVGKTVKYHIGKQFTIGGPGQDKVPTGSPAVLSGGSKISLPEVKFVYLRKMGRMTGKSDDNWHIASATVYMMNEEETRIFKLRGPLTLGIEDGLQVWLPEERA
jgi:hypothetical protein